jgi:DNA-binding NtrC family response regulator
MPTNEDTEVTTSPREIGARLFAMWPGGLVVRDLPEEGVLEIGRGDESDVKIDHASVSRKHARLHVTATSTAGAELRLEDLGSSNGTFVEGKRLASGETRSVRPDSLIEIGTVMLVIRGAGSNLAGALAGAPGAGEGEGAGLILADPEMERVHQLVELAARSNLSILLLGETGVGKDVIANRVHRLSTRAAAPFLKINCAAQAKAGLLESASGGTLFLKINCAALVESLLEAELFGYEKGAFTGAAQAKAGLLESASGGTLFLDEIGEMPMQTQAKLLRALENGEITRVGSTKSRAIDVRYVAATNQDLKQAIKEGRFRQDLYFRLEGIAIRVPPLRQRPSEIAPLVRKFAAEAAKSRGAATVQFSDAAMVRLTRYPWPGNLRELKNLVVRSTLLTSKPVLDVEDLHFEPMGLGETDDADAHRAPLGAGSSTETAALQVGGGVSEAERKRILDALEQCGGNQTRAAKLLGMSRGTLVNRLNAINVPRPRK